MDLARALKRRVEAEAETRTDKTPPAAGRDPADAFQRLSRAIRLTVALEARMAEALRALIAGEVAAAETAARRAETTRAKRREDIEAKVCDIVGQAMAAEIHDAEALDACH